MADDSENTLHQMSAAFMTVNYIHHGYMVKPVTLYQC